MKFKQQCTVDKVFDIVNYFLMFLSIVIFAYPLIYIVSASISSPESLWAGKLWLLPKDISMAAYKSVFENSDIWLGYKNTIILTVLGTAISLVLTVMAAYPLANRDFMMRTPLTVIYMITMFFNGGMIPTFLVIQKLHMLDTIWALILPMAIGFSNVLIVRTYFQTTIPGELREAALIDGCRHMRYLISVVLPLSMPVLAVMALFYGVSYWNSYFGAVIYITDRNKYPLQMFLREILIKIDMSKMVMPNSAAVNESVMLMETVKYAVIVVASLPVLMIYPFVQKYFVKGVMIGAVKG